MLMLFGGKYSKQMPLPALDDEWMKTFGSATLETTSNQICHGSVLGETELENAVTTME